MFMGLVMLLPLALLMAVGGFVAAFAMLRKGRSLRRPVIWLSVVLAIALGALFLFNCLAMGTCRPPAGFEELTMRGTMIAAYAGLPLVPLVGGFLVGLVLGGLSWRMTKGRQA